MTVEKTAHPAKSTLLQRALQGNAAFSMISGTVFLLTTRSLATALGLPNSVVLPILGVTLLLYGLTLLWVAAQTPIPRPLAIAAVVLDVGWVVGSVILLITNILPFTSTGRWVVIALADIVTVFAVLQAYGLWRMNVRRNAEII